MEQPALLNITRKDNIYRFRLDVPEGADAVGQEYVTELNGEMRERLRRVLQGAAQQMQASALTEVRSQTTKLSVVTDSVQALGRFLFDTLLPSPMQEALRRLDTPLILSTNTPDIPWELLFDGGQKTGRYLCRYLSVGRKVSTMLDKTQRMPAQDRLQRKGGRREAQGLAVLFLVNPTGERPRAEEEVAALCTTLPESVSRIILYRQQANPLEMRMRINVEAPQVVHYAGPLPTGDGALTLAGSSRLDESIAEQLLQLQARRPLVFLSHHEAERQQGRNGSAALSQQERDELMEGVAGKLMAAGAGAVVTMRWPVNMLRVQELVVLFYQELAEGVSLGESMRRARAMMVQRHPDDISCMAYVLYGDPTQRLAASSPTGKEQSIEAEPDLFDESQLIQGIPHDKSGDYGAIGGLERRFLQEVLAIALMEARRMRKDYLGTPHLFIALTKLDGGCTQEALRSLNFSPKQVRDVIRLALGSGKANSETPILPTRRCKEILQTAERNALNSGANLIDERSIAQAVLSEGDGVTHELLTKLGINPAQLIELILMSNAHALLELVPSIGANPGTAPMELPVGVIQEGASKGGTSLLDRLGRDLTRQASMGQLTPLIG
ncbi:MAG TPA: CHAT domain-containing protein, partial [Ktedonobacteraceae bacterium]|nr:CHAT domain-containing protein [Ktedonobacteraceae bacterium]